MHGVTMKIPWKVSVTNTATVRNVTSVKYVMGISPSSLHRGMPKENRDVNEYLR